MNSNVLQKDIKKYIYIRLIIEVNFIPTNGSPLIPKKKKMALVSTYGNRRDTGQLQKAHLPGCSAALEFKAQLLAN